MSYTSKSARILHYYHLEVVLTAEYLLEEFRPDLIEMVLDQLRPENVWVAIVSKGKLITQITQFCVEPSTSKKMYQMKRQNADLKWEIKTSNENEFIPTNFKIFIIRKRSSTIFFF